MNTLDAAIEEVLTIFADTSKLVRVVLSGRRRNMQTPAERIDLRPVLIKDQLHIQMSSTDGRAMTSKNFLPQEVDLRQMISSGFANILIETTENSLSIRIAKKGTPLISRSIQAKEQKLDHDKNKKRLLQPSDPFLIEVGISDSKGQVKPSRADKYRQVEEFLRLLAPMIESGISAGHLPKPTHSKPLRLVDLGCGHAYLTFAAHQYLRSIGIPVRVTGVDIRESSRDRNNEIAVRLGISDSIEFRAEEISATSIDSADVAIALHACDTATDDAIAWTINHSVPIAMIAPCCHHDIQSQMKEAPEPWGALVRNGIMKERLGDLLTDTLRMQIMKLRGYRTDAVEFVGGEHTPRNLMIRATFTGAKADTAEALRYQELKELWQITPALESRINS